MRRRSLVLLWPLLLAGCALAFSYGDYERVESVSDAGASGGSGGAVPLDGAFGGGAATPSGGADGAGTGGSADAETDVASDATSGDGAECPPKSICQDYSPWPECAAIFAPSGKTCGASCNDGLSSQSTCNSVGTCVGGAQVACTPYACSGNQCGTSCTLPAECAPGFTCSSTQCVDCQTCHEQLSGPSVAGWCPADSSLVWTALKQCCASSCQAECGDNLCAVAPTAPASVCTSCLKLKCAMAHAACDKDDKAE